jgi:mRNA-degrading endonuclease HigB of HigAB toxin-antitoxin module
LIRFRRNNSVLKSPACRNAVAAWYRVAKVSKWRSWLEVRRDFASADLVMNFQKQRMFVKGLMTHAEYDRQEWTKWNN